MKTKKLCCEIGCGHIYTPDSGEGRCPKCGSEGIWISRTILGIIDRKVNETLIKAGYKGELKWEE